jgi:hypothetical protein
MERQFSSDGIYYSNSLDPDQQISMEEQIAAYLHAETGLDEMTAQDMARSVLAMILKEFRPDLIEIHSPTRRGWCRSYLVLTRPGAVAEFADYKALVRFVRKLLRGAPRLSDGMSLREIAALTARSNWILEECRDGRLRQIGPSAHESKPWERDDLQFPRLIAEAVAAGAFTEEACRDLCQSMDLNYEDLWNLLNRAVKTWDRTQRHAKAGSLGNEQD